MVNVRIPDDLRDRIDAARGDVPRERWIRRTLESALSAAETREAPREALWVSDSAKAALAKQQALNDAKAKPAHAYKPRPKDGKR